MSLSRWKKISESVLFRNSWWTYKRDMFSLPSGKPGEYHYVHTNGSSMVIPVLDDGTILMVNQYRYLAERESMEFPCGSVEDGSSYDQTASHELAQETGYSAKKISMVGEFNPYNGVTDEMCRIYIAKELQFVGGVPDDTEEFELVSLTPGQIDDNIRTGVIWDGMSVAAWCISRAKVG
jgi:ADP-ribose pyrophosphatase